MIWVIGCNGMLGQEICRQLEEKNIQFVKTDMDVSILDYSALEAFAKGWSIDWIINCAAYTAVDKAETDVELCTKLNVIGPENIAKVAKKVGAKLIHISTDYVFDGTGGFDGLNHQVPYTEEMAVAPIGVYGVTKADGEKAVMANTSAYYIIRTAWLYGWAGKNFVYTMLKAMNARESVKVVADQKGTPTFAGDLAEVILKIISKANVPYGVYHCTDLGETTWFDFTNEIKKQGITSSWLTNKECVVNPCTTEEYPTPAKRPAYSVLSKDKIQKALGITLPDWKESLGKFLNSPLFDKSRIE